MPKPGATVFVVDHDASVRAPLEGLIRSAGLGVATHATAQAFLAGPRAEGPSCLVLDLRLPGLGGATIAVAPEVSRPAEVVDGRPDMNWRTTRARIKFDGG